MCRRPPRKYAVFAERISRASKQPVYLRHKAGRGRGATSDEDTGIRFNVCIVDRGDDHRTFFCHSARVRVDLNVEDDAIAREVERRARYIYINIYVCVYTVQRKAKARERERWKAEGEEEKEKEKSGKG